MSTRDMVNEILKTDRKNNGIVDTSEVIKMIYVIYKDIEKIKQHLKIDNS
jgi:hypothetical protein